ncbi:hypothetical protein FB45DRAFT_353942 [Roridomyces roridus]|uniref:Uncharacterized protein n=1 Tax=Roridomyces roridus TaxID=1738132 RepID=A0AAD7C765_9AGAR|nr:hypothetical protein FB45DRAFT_353942 [Roridomyces roridus]
MPALPPSPPPVPWGVLHLLVAFGGAVVLTSGALYLALHVSDVLAKRRSCATSDLEKGTTPPTLSLPAKLTRSAKPKALAAAAVLQAAREKIHHRAPNAPTPTLGGSLTAVPAAKLAAATPVPTVSVATATVVQVPRLVHLSSSNAGDEVSTARFAVRHVRPKLRPSPLRGVVAISEPEPAVIVAPVPLRLNVDALPIAVTLAHLVEEDDPNGDDLSFDNSNLSFFKEDDDDEDDDELIPLDSSFMLSTVDMWIPGLVGSRSTGSVKASKTVVVGIVSSSIVHTSIGSRSRSSSTNTTSSSSTTASSLPLSSPTSSISLTTTTTTNSLSSPPPLRSRPVLGDSRYNNVQRAPQVRTQVAKLGVPLRGSSGTTHRRIGERLERNQREKENNAAGAWIRRPSPVLLTR